MPRAGRQARPKASMRRTKENLGRAVRVDENNKNNNDNYNDDDDKKKKLGGKTCPKLLV